MTKRPVVLIFIAAFGLSASLSWPGQADIEYALSSPNNAIEVRIAAGAALTYSIRHGGGELMAPSAVSMSLEGGRILGRNAEVRDARRRSVDEKLTPVVKQKAAVIRDQYNELTLEFRGDYSVTFRAYDDGAAYRFATAFPGQITVVSEQAEFAFTKDHRVYFPEEESFYTHQERLYKYIPISEITAKRFCSVPALVDVAGGPKVAITEADLEDYAGLYLTGLDGAPTKLVGTFPAYPLKEQPKGDRNVLVTERAGYIAKTSGKRVFPWRALMIAERDGGLIENSMMYRLAKPSTGDFSWVRPGKVAWDWWNDLNVSDVDFRAGVNTATYRYFIDFAAKYGIEYIILDEGWSERGDLLKVVPAINMEELIAYARQKRVGIILWVTWKTLDEQLEPAMNQFSRWGIQGLKVDFMQRDDQWMVNYYYRVAAETAKRHFLVDFHGAYKPTGLIRTFPNVLTSEGVRGLENSKWSKDITPNHDVQLPFIRMAAGPMDFTPGAMVNGTQRSFQFIYNQPMSQGTRCHQLAMYVVYESPLQMLADTPTNYLREPEAMAFLSRVPTVWDETHALDGKVGEYVLVARRNGSNWYLGAMTSWTPRDLSLDLSFLGAGNYDMLLYQDGLNADRNGSDYKMIKRTVTRADKLVLKLAPGGGWAAVISPRSR